MLSERKQDIQECILCGCIYLIQKLQTNLVKGFPGDSVLKNPPSNEGMVEGLEQGSRRRGYMHTYDWFMLLYNRNQHKIVKQLYTNFLKIKNKQRSL